MSTPTIQHLLLLPEGTDPQFVDWLVSARYPNVERLPQGEMRVGRHITVQGPLPDDDPNVFRSWPVAFAFTTPLEREDPPLPGVTDADGLYRAFPLGLPGRAEGRCVDLMLAIARRLGGAVRISDSGIILVPDDLSRITVTVYSAVWFEPTELLRVLQVVAPSARTAMDGQEWGGPPPGIVDNPPDRFTGFELTEAQRIAIQAQADQYDAAVLASDMELDAYACEVDLGPTDGLIEIRVTGEGDEDIPALACLGWRNAAISYAIDWIPTDPMQLELEEPSEQHIRSRAMAHYAIAHLARAIHHATRGVVVDADGFIVEPETLTQ